MNLQSSTCPDLLQTVAGIMADIVAVVWLDFSQTQHISIQAKHRPHCCCKAMDVPHFVSEFLEWMAACGASDEEVMAVWHRFGIAPGNIAQADLSQINDLTLG